MRIYIFFALVLLGSCISNESNTTKNVIPKKNEVAKVLTPPPANVNASELIGSDESSEFGPTLLSFELSESYVKMHHMDSKGYIFVLWEKPKTTQDAPTMIFDNGMTDTTNGKSGILYVFGYNHGMRYELDYKEDGGIPSVICKRFINDKLTHEENGTNVKKQG